MLESLLDMLESITGQLEDTPEASSDSEALLRTQLANTLAEALRILRALANDELKEKK